MKSRSVIQRKMAPSEAVETPDLDVTPVMNMFIILIPFLVSMAVFTHLAVLKFNLPPNVGTSLDDSQDKPKLKVTVVIAPNYLAIARGENLLDSIARTTNDYNLVVLKQQLRMRREVAEIQDEAIVAVSDRIAFKHVVGVMDACRESGFEKIGLSTATLNTDSNDAWGGNHPPLTHDAPVAGASVAR